MDEVSISVVAAGDSVASDTCLAGELLTVYDHLLSVGASRRMSRQGASVEKSGLAVRCGFQSRGALLYATIQSEFGSGAVTPMESDRIGGYRKCVPSNRKAHHAPRVKS